MCCQNKPRFPVEVPVTQPFEQGVYTTTAIQVGLPSQKWWVGLWEACLLYHRSPHGPQPWRGRCLVCHWYRPFTQARLVGWWVGGLGECRFVLFCSFSFLVAFCLCCFLCFAFLSCSCCFFFIPCFALLCFALLCFALLCFALLAQLLPVFFLLLPLPPSLPPCPSPSLPPSLPLPRFFPSSCSTFCFHIGLGDFGSCSGNIFAIEYWDLGHGERGIRSF